MVVKRSVVRFLMVVWATGTFLVSLRVFTSNNLNDNHLNHNHPNDNHLNHNHPDDNHPNDNHLNHNHLKDSHLNHNHPKDRHPIPIDNHLKDAIHTTLMLRRKKLDSKKDDPVFERKKLIDDFKALVHADHVHADENRTGWDLYFQFKNTGTRIWPEKGEVEDRILNQIHLVHRDAAGKKLKRILLNAGLDNGMEPGQSRFIEHKCPVNQCSLTDRAEDAATADAILFKDWINTPTFPRPPNQIWILFMLESPYHTPPFSDMESQINWTATYRTDSTMVTPYERYTFFANYTGLPEQAPRNYAAGKTKMVAWFVSNCGAPNGRMNYAKELSNYIQVDIYGACGSLVCNRFSDPCNDKLKADYKFYLAFENSNCKDYITEKLYWNALQNDVLPIVMGAMPEDYLRLAPPKSYIHVDDFESPRALAQHLQMLDDDDEQYNSYFRWKGTGKFIDTKFWCRLCTMVHESGRSKHRMVFDELNEWWRGPDVCVNPQEPSGWSSWRNVSREATSKDLFRSWTE